MVELRELYDRVFHEDGTAKLCGREACKNLIIKLQEKFPGEDFGNLDTGMMNVNNIHKKFNRG